MKGWCYNKGRILRYWLLARQAVCTTLRYHRTEHGRFWANLQDLLLPLEAAPPDTPPPPTAVTSTDTPHEQAEAFVIHTPTEQQEPEAAGISDTMREAQAGLDASVVRQVESLPPHTWNTSHSNEAHAVPPNPYPITGTADRANTFRPGGSAPTCGWAVRPLWHSTHRRCVPRWLSTHWRLNKTVPPRLNIRRRRIHWELRVWKWRKPHPAVCSN